VPGYPSSSHRLCPLWLGALCLYDHIGCVKRLQEFLDETNSFAAGNSGRYEILEKITGARYCNMLPSSIDENALANVLFVDLFSQTGGNQAILDRFSTFFEKSPELSGPLWNSCRNLYNDWLGLVGQDSHEHLDQGAGNVYEDSLGTKCRAIPCQQRYLRMAARACIESSSSDPLVGESRRQWVTTVTAAADTQIIYVTVRRAATPTTGVE